MGLPFLPISRSGREWWLHFFERCPLIHDWQAKVVPLTRTMCVRSRFREEIETVSLDEAGVGWARRVLSWRV